MNVAEPIEPREARMNLGERGRDYFSPRHRVELYLAHECRLTFPPAVD